jgi:hypothetical protein
MMAAPVPARYERRKTIFNEIVEDPRLVSRETEWLSMKDNSDRSNG